MARYKFQLVVEPLEEGGFLVTSPDVPGLLTEGDTIEEALANVPDAVETLIEAMQLKGMSLPTALQHSVDEDRPLRLDALIAIPQAEIA